MGMLVQTHTENSCANAAYSYRRFIVNCFARTSVLNIRQQTVKILPMFDVRLLDGILTLQHQTNVRYLVISLFKASIIYYNNFTIN